jgi:hypothetical protein
MGRRWAGAGRRPGGRRWLAEDKATLHELADEYRVSAERIRQIEEQRSGHDLP